MKNKQNILQHSMVEFTFANATPNSQSVNLFDTNTGADTPGQNNADAYPNTLGQQITVGTNYNGIAYDNTRKTIAVGDSSGNFKIIDTSTGNTLYTTTITVAATKIIYIENTDKFYAIGTVGAATNIVSVINASNGAESTTITLPGGIYSDLIYCNTENTIYFLDSTATQLLIGVNATTNTQTSALSLPVGAGASRFTYANSVNSLYVFATTLQKIYVVSCSTNIITTTIAAAGGTKGGVYNSDNNQVYYHDSTAGNIKIINIITNTISATIIAGFANSVLDVVYSLNTNHIWTLNFGGGLSSIKIIDCDNNTVSDTLVMPALWNGKLVYANNINTTYSTSNAGALLNYVQQIDASANQFYIEGSANYNLFVKDTLVNPKKIDRITIYGESISDLSNPLIFNYTDAMGQDCEKPKVPINKVSVMQQQGQIAQLNIKDFVLDVNTYINYTIPAFTTIKWIIFYKNYKRSNAFTGTVNIGNTQQYDKNYLLKTEVIPDWINHIETIKIINKLQL